MKITEKQDTVNIWGIEWNHSIEQLSEDMEIEIGCLVDVYSNNELMLRKRAYKVNKFAPK